MPVVEGGVATLSGLGSKGSASLGASGYLAPAGRIQGKVCGQESVGTAVKADRIFKQMATV
jgi:hypothetical protein